nr:MAG TPA: hypothetical protein [Bacteriophage sp.]
MITSLPTDASRLVISRLFHISIVQICAEVFGTPHLLTKNEKYE